MANKKTKKEESDPNLPQVPIPGLPPELQNMSKDMEKKLMDMKEKTEKFKTKVLEKFDKYIIGLAILPPEKKEDKEGEDLTEKAEAENPNAINILVLVDDSDVKKMSADELHARLSHIIEIEAKAIDKNMTPKVMIVSDLKEACFDGKYDILKMVSMAAPIYDPTDFLAAIRISEVHRTMTIKKFDKYILSYVAAGSLFRGEKSNDIDVYVVVDDTDVKKMSRAELKDKLRAIIVSMGFEASRITGVKKQFHVQTYILTDFWDAVKDANPVIFTFLRDGVPLYDRGVFMPWKLLLKMGRVKPSPEAIDMNMDIGEKLLERIKHKMLSVVGEDLYYAVLNPAQAALMLYGIPPPTPKETIQLMNEVFVKKEKLLEKKYVDILEKIRTAYKNIEHGKTTEVSGKDIDDMLKDAQDYLQRIKKMFKQIEEKAEKESILEVYDSCVAVTRDLLATNGHTEVKDNELEKLFKEVLVVKEKLPEKLLRVLKTITKAKDEFLAGTISKQEVNKIKKEARQYIKLLVDHLQRKRMIDLERVKIRFKHGEKFGEALVFEDDVFINLDMEKREELLHGKLAKNGLTDIAKSSLEELEKHISKFKQPERRVSVNSALLQSLKELAKEEVEVLLG